MSLGRVLRRIAALQAGGVLYFDLDMAPAAMGSGIAAFLWLNVGPAQATKMAALDGVHSFELSPVLRRLEQAGALTVGDRLAQPTSAPTRRSR
jgi:hypothetical protein